MKRLMIGVVVSVVRDDAVVLSATGDEPTGGAPDVSSARSDVAVYGAC